MNARDRKAPDRLAELLDRAESLGWRLSFDELREVASLYRVSSARLAILRSRGRDPEAIHYLNALCVRAYTHLQVSAPQRRRIGSFFLAQFPATLAATAWLQGLTAALMLAGAMVGWMLVSANPAALDAIIPASMYPPIMLERLAGSAQQRARFLARPGLGFGWKSVFSAGLFVHNTKVGLFAFTTGILAGVPTVLLVFYNGMTIGAFVWIFSRDTSWPIFWAWLLPHAIPELLAVTLCSAGGLVIARAVVAPGRQGVAASLRACGSGAADGPGFVSAVRRRRGTGEFPAGVGPSDRCKVCGGSRLNRGDWMRFLVCTHAGPAPCAIRP